MGREKILSILSLVICSPQEGRHGKGRELSKIFNKFYNKLPLNIKPVEATAMVYYLGSFANDFSIMFRQIQSQTLLQMQGDVVALERNLMMGGNIKKQLKDQENRNGNRNQERRKPKEDSQQST